MRTIIKKWIGVTTLSLGLTCVSARADQAAAEDDAYTMAIKTSAKGYKVSPVYAGLLTSGSVFEIVIPVQAGNDYAVLVGKDAFVYDMSLYVVSEFGSILNKDYRNSVSRAGVQFRSDYTGEARAYVIMESAYKLGGFAVLVGQREAFKPYGGGAGGAGDPGPN